MHRCVFVVKDVGKKADKKADIKPEEDSPSTRQIPHTRCSEEHTMQRGTHHWMWTTPPPSPYNTHTGTSTQPYTTPPFTTQPDTTPAHPPYTAHSCAPQTAHISGGEAQPGQLGAEGQGKVHLAHHSWHATGCNMQQHTGHDLAVTHGRGAVVHYR